MYFLYILQSSLTDKFYIGHTENLHLRFQQHNDGYSKSTRSGIPWKIVYTEKFQTRSDAMKRGYEIKSMKSRLYIFRLIGNSK